jgi:putative SOS response-associated peptidase YedK
MCGRFRREIHFERLREKRLIKASQVAPNRYDPAALNIKPTTMQWIIRPSNDGPELVEARWWLVPFFHRGPLKAWRATTFNAKMETVATAPSYRDAFKKRRCLVPASGWYEWTGEKGAKTPHLFTAKGDDVLTFAGIWDRTTTADEGVVESFSIITQPAGALLNAYHDRAPVVIWPGDRERYLDAAADVTSLLGPESPDLFDVSEASPDVLRAG